MRHSVNLKAFMIVVWSRRLAGRILLAAGLCLVFAGCRTHYDITMTNGSVIRSYDKPKLNERGYFVFKDASGQPQEVNKMRVRQIEPARPGSKPSSDSFFLQH
jgi:hypothetical protein